MVVLVGKEEEVVDWSSCLPDDAAITIFSRLSCRDRASLSSTSSSLRAVGNSPYLWQELDLRPHNFDAEAASSLASRCKNLRKLRIRCPESADAILNLQAKNLRELSVDGCSVMTDVTLCLLAARHEALECLQINVIASIFCVMISSRAVKAIAICCPQLKRLLISNVREVDVNAINAFAKYCKNLTDIGFVDCGVYLDVAALGNIASLKFVSVAGTTIRNWNQVVQHWSKLPCLTGVDVSRTNIPPDIVSGIFLSSFSLKVLCALNCPKLEGDATFVSNDDHNGKALVSVFTGILATCNSNYKKETEISNWLECIISSWLLCKSKCDPKCFYDFRLNQGTNLLLSISQSSHDEVQERAVTALANFLAHNGDDTGWAQAVMRGGDRIRVFLNQARSWREELQLGAAKIIANLSVNDEAAKALLDEGGISILAYFARSANKLVAGEALGALSNLSVQEEQKCSIDESIGVETLFELISRWSSSAGGERVLEHVLGVLANLATVDKCRAEIASVGGVNALTTLIQTCKVERVIEKAFHVLKNMTALCYTKGDYAGVGLDTGAFDALVQLTRSPRDGVRNEAACALCYLCYDDRNREAIAAAGGVEALVALAISCSNASPDLKCSTAGALWGLSYSEAHSIAICQEGGVVPLIELAQSDNMDVHETAVAALWSLCFCPKNAPRIIEELGVDFLAYLSSYSRSKLARLMCALALTYMLDQRMDDEIAMMGTSTDKSVQRVRRMAMKHVEDFVKAVSDPQLLSAAATSSDPALLSQLTQFSCIPEAGREAICSEAEIRRFVVMLQNPCSTLKSCAAFALLQFTIPENGEEHVSFLQNAGAQAVLQAAAEDEAAPLEMKTFARLVLRNMERPVLKT